MILSCAGGVRGAGEHVTNVECEKTQNLWENIILFINKVFGIDLSQSPALCILGIVTEGAELSLQQTLWCRLALRLGIGLL